MYMTNEKWEQNNQDYLKESYEETGFTAGGYAVRKLICGGCGNTAKCAVRIWYASAAVKNSHLNVQMPAIAAMPVGKKTIENVLRMLQVLKMSTWLSVTHLPNETQSLTNEGTEIHRPVTENQVVKMSTSFSVTLQGLLKIRCRHPALDFTRNGIRGSK